MTQLEAIAANEVPFTSSSERREIFEALHRQERATVRPFFDPSARLLTRAQGYTLVGTPDYMAPEMIDNRGRGYDLLVDYWSLGCMLFEFLAGITPFCHNSIDETWRDIINFERTLDRGLMQPPVSDAAWDLITRLLTHKELRLRNLASVQAHPWFAGVRWDRLREGEPPFVPTIAHAEDTSNFDQPTSLGPNAFDPATSTVRDDFFRFVCWLTHWRHTGRSGPAAHHRVHLQAQQHPRGQVAE